MTFGRHITMTLAVASLALLSVPAHAHAGEPAAAKPAAPQAAKRLNAVDRLRKTFAEVERKTDLFRTTHLSPELAAAARAIGTQAEPAAGAVASTSP
jgi:hypothetical protein